MLLPRSKRKIGYEHVMFGQIEIEVYKAKSRKQVFCKLKMVPSEMDSL